MKKPVLVIMAAGMGSIRGVCGRKKAEQVCGVKSGAEH